ncbi:hypothetical protein FQN50_008210 [Emmonsiellopsis sp. PD_5]|nr:hypothetical protein FQN50_008210 [Emmonsiellopsis sp. PD_5]
MAPKKVAIVGGGCSGLAAFWALRNTDHEAHIYDSANRLGGITHLAQYEKNGNQVNVDVGLVCFNPLTSPNLYAFLRELRVPLHDVPFSLASSRDGGLFEWSSGSVLSLVSRNLFRLDLWRLLFDIVKFNYFAPDLLREEEKMAERMSHGRREATESRDDQQTPMNIGTYLKKEGYSHAFRDHYIIPIISVLWSVHDPIHALEFPITMLLRSMANGGLLRCFLFWPKWVTAAGMENIFDEAIQNTIPAERLHLNMKIDFIKVCREEGYLALYTDKGEEEHFDHFIIATSAEEALRMISADATDDEVQALGRHSTIRTIAILHSDRSFMPKRPRTWGTLNHISLSSLDSHQDDSTSQFSISYHINPLQNLPERRFGPIFITLNPITPPHPLCVQGIWEYSRSTLTNRARTSQHLLLPKIQNTRGISYCGPWTGCGGYEDAVRSGLMVATEHLGARLPFEIVEDPEGVVRGRMPVLTKRKRVVRLFVRVLLLVLLVMGVVRRVLLYFYVRWRGGRETRREAAAVAAKGKGKGKVKGG